MRWIIAAALAATLAGCDNGDPGGWYPDMTCNARDLKSGRCTDAKYSCSRFNTALAFYRVGARCMEVGQ